jgi:hypothetical protein
MGRYIVELAGPPPGQETNMSPIGWPTVFNKPIVALDLNGLIVEDVPLIDAQSIKIIPGVLEAIKIIRQKGHKLFILSDQPNILKGKTTQQNIDACFQELMQIFGQAGIFSIEPISAKVVIWSSLAAPWRGPQREAIPAEILAKGFARELPAILTAVVEGPWSLSA